MRWVRPLAAMACLLALVPSEARPSDPTASPPAVPLYRPEVLPAQIPVAPGATEPADTPPPPASEAKAEKKEKGEKDEGKKDKGKKDKDEDEALEERLKKLEEEWKKQEEAAEGSGRPTVEIDGRIHLDSTFFLNDSPGIGFFEHPATGVDPENRLGFRRLRLTFQGEAWWVMFYKLDVEFSEPENPQIRDAYIGFEELPVLQTLIVGSQKRPLGFDHLNSSNVNIFMERPMVIDGFNEETRRLGVAFYGYNEEESLNWTVGVFNLENILDDGVYVSDPLQLSFNTRLSGTPWYDEASGGRGYLHLAVANMVADPNGFADARDSAANQARFRSRPEVRTESRWLDTLPIGGADWFDVVGLEAVFTYGPLTVVSEYQTNWVGREARPGFPAGPDVFFHGAYVYLAYFLTGEHMPLDRRQGVFRKPEPFENFFLVERCCGRLGAGWGAWQVAVRYSYLDLTDADILGGRESNVTFGLNWWFNPNSRLMMNYVLGDIREHRPVGGFTAGHFNALAMRLQFDW